MPTYDYRCEANGQIIEVYHRMNETLTSWGEICEFAAIDPDGIPADSPVTRLATGGQVVTRPTSAVVPPRPVRPVVPAVAVDCAT